MSYKSKFLAGVIACVVAAGGLSACGGGGGTAALIGVPQCVPNSPNCQQTLGENGEEGIWIPSAYWPILLSQQNLANNATPTYQSEIPASQAPASIGASDEELEGGAAEGEEITDEETSFEESGGDESFEDGGGEESFEDGGEESFDEGGDEGGFEDGGGGEE